MKSSMLLISILVVLFFSLNSPGQIIGCYPPADSVTIGFGCTPPIIVASISPTYSGIDTIIIYPGWNTIMAVKDSTGDWEQIERSYFLVKDSLDQFDYELWYHPRFYPGPPILVPFDSAFECYDQSFDVQLIVKEQNVAVDSLTISFDALVGLDIGQEENDLLLAQQARLYQNYPNPFNPTTNIPFFLPKASPVKIEVFDMAGKKMATVLESRKSAGSHQIEFGGNGLASGIYFCRLEAGQFVDVKKMILIK